MNTQGSPRWRVVLSARLLDDAARAGLLAGIQEMAPQSALTKVATVAASVDALAKKGAALTANVTAAVAAEKQYKATLAQRDESRDAFDKELLALKAAVESVATSESDVKGMGFTPLTFTKASPTQPEPPVGLMVKVGKAHGKARVVVAGAAPSARFVAEVSPDPAGQGTWSSLPGTGRERKLSGYASGMKLWVRFAAVRYGLQSDWCTPVLVTIP
jgi:hypothetical protein